MFGPAAAEFASIILLCTSSLPFTQGQSNNYQPVPSPNLDLGSMGRLALGGDFDAISLYTYYGQTEGLGGNGSQSILSTLPNGAFDMLSSADASINAMCPFVMKNGQLAGIVVGGNFTSLGGVNVQSIALFDPTSMKVTPLPGIFGTVSAILCDQDTNAVYVGGSFKAANSTNAIAWIGMTGWANLPFAGFNAPVTSITKAPNGHIVFGGSFNGLGNSTIPTALTGQQVINLASANITSGSSTTTTGYSNPQNIACPSNGTSGPGNTWLLQDNTPGYWRAQTQFGFEPRKLRMWNTNEDGRGVKTFRFTAHPLDGIMNLTYTDPSSGETIACDATCNLPQNTSYLDYTFVNTVGMNGFQIDVSEWYGKGGGLNGIELFEDDIFAFAVEAFNEPACSNVPFPSNVTTTGLWSVLPAQESVSDYLSTSMGVDTLNTLSVVFQPDIKQAGNYSVTVYTPGCVQDGTCGARGIVNITATLTSAGGEAISAQIYQTNDFDKYDQIFLGKVDAASSAFRPAVTLTPASGPANRNVVASRVEFGQISSQGGLNGLFDFNPNQAVVDTDFSKSAINNAGTELHPNAIVNALITRSGTIYAAGAFSDDVFENIMAFSNNSATSLPGGGLNAPVFAMYTMEDFLYVAGNFTNSNQGNVTGLSNVGAYQYSKNAWVTLGAGLNGPVDTIVPLQMNITVNKPETVIGFSGSFTQVLASGNSQASFAKGFTVWVPSHNDWLQNLNGSQPLLTGQLTSYADVPNGPFLVAGTIASEGNAISGAASLSQYSGTEGLDPFPFKIQSDLAKSSLSKRALTVEQNITGITTVSYYNNQGRNVTVFGGHFTATVTNGSTIQNLLFLNGSNNDAVTGLPSGMDSNSTVFALATQNDLLFAGGSVTGNVTGSSVDGVVVYDLHAAAFIDAQPPALQGDNVIVNDIKVRPGTSEVYVGGAFDSAGSLPCSTVCMFQPSTGQWNAAGSNLGGSVSALFWSSGEKMLAAGSMTVSGSKTSLATYDAKQQNWTAISSTQIPGSVTAFAPAKQDLSSMWVAGTATNGSSFLMEIDGNNYRPVGDVFGSGTTIRGLQVLSLSQPHGSTPMLDDSQVLLVCGQLGLPTFGKASAALYNGTDFTPFVFAATLDGQSGTIANLFSSITNPLKSGGKSSPMAMMCDFIALTSTKSTIILEASLCWSRYVLPLALSS
jgi:hypothetical protein